MILAGRGAGVAILLLFWATLAGSVRQQSATYDEIGHATGGYTYWKFNDYRINPENGILPQRVFALPLLADGLRFPDRQVPAWSVADALRLGDDWFHREGNDAIAMLWRGRLAASLFAVAMAALVWHCSRQLFGEAGGLLSLLLCVLNPTVLANGPLMTADTASAFFFLASAWSWWAMLHRPGMGRVVVSSAALAGLFLTKMSAPLILPCLGIMAAVRLLRDWSRPGGEVGGGPAGRRPGVAAIAGAGVFHAVAVVAAVWGCYGFRYYITPAGKLDDGVSGRLWLDVDAPPGLAEAVDALGLSGSKRAAVQSIVDAVEASPQQSADTVAAARREIAARLAPAEVRQLEQLLAGNAAAAPIRLIGYFRRHHVLPEAYLLGYARVWRHSRTRLTFFRGRFSSRGSPLFFPFTFAVKTPWPTLALLALAVGGIGWHGWRRRHERGWAWLDGLLPLGTILGVYGAAALGSRLNIGHRHILVLYPPLCVLAGAAAGLGGGIMGAMAGRHARLWRLAAAALVATQALEMAWRFPHYLAYFNGLVAPARAYREVVDSSLDWGQELPGLKHYIEHHPSAQPVYVAYFGTADPRTYGIAARFLPSVPGLFLEPQPPLVWQLLPPGVTDLTAAGREISHRFPHYEPVVARTAEGATRVLLMRNRDSFRLTGGTYVVSATMLQTPWDEQSEAAYQALRRVVEPFLASDRATREANLRAAGTERWSEAISSWEKARFGRLAAFLRQREPVDEIGFAMMVYTVTDDDLARALAETTPGVRLLGE